MGSKEGRIVNQILHTIAKEIVTYAKQFNKPLIVMEYPKKVRENTNDPSKPNRSLHT
ncbi:MAG TPA: hypothetical protein EYG81_06140 [Archaeoglobus profundus]|nr:hypothetical protein [Archaeoglobus profundus]